MEVTCAEPHVGPGVKAWFFDLANIASPEHIGIGGVNRLPPFD